MSNSRLLLARFSFAFRVNDGMYFCSARYIFCDLIKSASLHPSSLSALSLPTMISFHFSMHLSLVFFVFVFVFYVYLLRAQFAKACLKPASSQFSILTVIYFISESLKKNIFFLIQMFIFLLEWEDNFVN